MEKDEVIEIQIKKTLSGWELKNGISTVSYSYLRDSGGVTGLLNDLYRILTK